MGFLSSIPLIVGRVLGKTGNEKRWPQKNYASVSRPFQNVVVHFNSRACRPAEEGSVTRKPFLGARLTANP